MSESVESEYPSAEVERPAYSLANRLRQELSARNRRYASEHCLPMRESYGLTPVVCYLPADDDSCHGNFLPEAYRAILGKENWCKRLRKVHTQARNSLPRVDRRWRELDSCNSSDALLMNIFCFPGTLEDGRVFDLLGVHEVATPQFGFKARVPLMNGKMDRTEVDMLLGDLLVESKLTETDFQAREVSVVESYHDFHEVFEADCLPRSGDHYLSDQLIRNVLAAYDNDCSFCVMADARRPDLREAWYGVMRCVRILDLRLRCKMLTWQELSEVLPVELQEFLREKYGIFSGSAPDLDEDTPEFIVRS